MEILGFAFLWLLWKLWKGLSARHYAPKSIPIKPMPDGMYTQSPWQKFRATYLQADPAERPEESRRP